MTVTRSGKKTRPEGDADTVENNEEDYMDLDNSTKEADAKVTSANEDADAKIEPGPASEPKEEADAAAIPETVEKEPDEANEDVDMKDAQGDQTNGEEPASKENGQSDEPKERTEKDTHRDRKGSRSERDPSRERRRSRDRHKSKERDRDRDRSKDRSHKRSRDDREEDKEKSKRSRSRRSRSQERSSRRSRSREKSSRRSRSRDRKSSRRERSRSKGRKSRRRSSSRSRRRSPSLRKRSRSRRRRSSSRSRRRRSPSFPRRRSRSRDFGAFRGGRRRSPGGSEEEGFGGYVPRKRQEAPKPAGYSTAFIDPYAALRSKKPLPTDPEGIKRSMREQQLQARQMVLQQQATSAVAAASKTQREIYVGNLVQGLVTEESLRQLFNSTMKAAFPDGARTPGEPCTSVSMHSEGRYAFVELKSSEMASAALQLSGQVQLLGQNISVGRPSGYVDPSAAQMAAAQAATALQAFEAGSMTLEQTEEAMNSIHMPGATSASAPPEATAEPVLALPPPPGPAPPPGALPPGAVPGGPPQGYAGLPPQGLPGPPSTMGGGPSPGAPPPSFVPPSGSPTPFLQVEGMVTAEVLRDDGEYAEVIEDLRDECGKFGQILTIVVPRPNPALAHQLFGTGHFGKAFVQFSDVNASIQAKNAIHGRLFLGVTIQAQFVSYPEFMAAQQ